MASKRATEFPKIDLHRHWDGDLSYETVKYLADKDGVTMPGTSPQQWRAWIDGLRDEGLANVFKKGFGFVTGLLQTSENITYAAYEEVRQLAKDNIIYAELRLAPEYHIGANEYYGHKKPEHSLNYHEIFIALQKGLKQGEKDFGVITKAIPCINREALPAKGLQIAWKIIDFVEHRWHDIVAVDLACDEWNFPPQRHRLAFETISVWRDILPATIHAGEFGQDNYQNMKTALELGATRLGHAREISSYPDLIKAIRSNKVGIEMCPLSNLYCGLIKTTKELRIDELLDQDLLVSVNTDDPAMFGYNLSDVIDRLVEEAGLSWGDVALLQFNAVASAFLSPLEREKIRFRLASELWQKLPNRTLQLIKKFG